MRYTSWMGAVIVAGGAALALGQEAPEGSLGLFRDIPVRPAQTAPTPSMVFAADWNPNAVDQAADKAVREALDKPLAKFAVAQTALPEVLAAFSKEVGLSVSVDWTALEAAGVAKNTRVSVNMERVPARRVLREILSQASPAAPMNVAFLVDGGTVVVTARENLQREQFQTTVAYDLGFVFADVELRSQAADDLRESLIATFEQTFEPDSWRDNGGIAGMIRFLGATMLVHARGDLQVQIGQLVTSMRAGSERSLRSYDVRDLAGDTDKEKMARLIDVIQTSCGRETWRGKGGSSSSVSGFEGKLYINASPAVHQQIENLLALMRKK